MAKRTERRKSPHGTQTRRYAPARAAYIAEMAAQLARMAEADGLKLTAYFLRMAHLEAEAQARAEPAGESRD